MLISDWSSDVCSSDLVRLVSKRLGPVEFVAGGFYTNEKNLYRTIITVNTAAGVPLTAPFDLLFVADTISNYEEEAAFGNLTFYLSDKLDITGGIRYAHNSQFAQTGGRSEEHTSELQSLMRISYAVFCLKKKTTRQTTQDHNIRT